MGREYWGKGIATRALADFLSMVKERPLYAFTAKTNLAYIRVLHKCGFRQIGGEQEFSQVNGENVEGVIVMLRSSERRGKMQGRVWTFREETVGEVRSRVASLDGSQVHSVRLPGYVIRIEAIFGEPDERLSIRHDAGSGVTPYTQGTLLAIRKVQSVPGLVRGLDKIMD